MAGSRAWQGPSPHAPQAPTRQRHQVYGVYTMDRRTSEQHRGRALAVAVKLNQCTQTDISQLKLFSPSHHLFLFLSFTFPTGT